MRNFPFIAFTIFLVTALVSVLWKDLNRAIDEDSKNVRGGGQQDMARNLGGRRSHHKRKKSPIFYSYSYDEDFEKGGDGRRGKGNGKGGHRGRGGDKKHPIFDASY